MQSDFNSSLVQMCSKFHQIALDKACLKFEKDTNFTRSINSNIINMADWNTLLTPHTFRNRTKPKDFDGRNPFENDYGRLISSSPIRRLQDKTQVFPLEQSDFIRTRLTHSLEVSYIGSSIGQSVESFLIKENHLSKDKIGHISSLLRVAGLIHDLGNPPFGHFGEVAVQNFFKDFFKDNDRGLSKQQIADYQNFDGNVQSFRILTKLHFFGDEYSFNLTYPSLASIIKYPKCSLTGNQPKNSDSYHLTTKKFGYYASEEEQFNEINLQLELKNNRHPVTYLLEAADDIAYSAADIEDGVKLGLLNAEIIRETFAKELNQNRDLLAYWDKLTEDFKSLKSEGFPTVVQKFRVKTQSRMIECVIKYFEQHNDSVMQGNLNGELIDLSEGADIRRAFKKLQYIVFDNKKIMQAELAGWEAIHGLLGIFIPAALTDGFNDSENTRESRLFKNISSSYRYLYSKYPSSQNDLYNRIQLVVDFISGMTDSYAVNLYQKLTGIKTN